MNFYVLIFFPQTKITLELLEKKFCTYYHSVLLTALLVHSRSTFDLTEWLESLYRPHMPTYIVYLKHQELPRRVHFHSPLLHFVPVDLELFIPSFISFIINIKTGTLKDVVMTVVINPRNSFSLFDPIL
jgi:hypothetical protein